MNEKGNKYTPAALKDRRATMAGEIVQMKEGIRDREEQFCPGSDNSNQGTASTDQLRRPISTPAAEHLWRESSKAVRLLEQQ